LDDIQRAAMSVGIVGTITTAKTGHNRFTKGSDNVSRHMNGTGIDISNLNGIDSSKATNATDGNPQFRELGTKLKDALVSMGYVWNTESGKDKAVLWQTNTGGNHFNHLHISNRAGVSTQEPTTSGTTSDNTTTTTPDVSGEQGKSEDLDVSGGAGAFARKLGGQILNAIGIKESFDVSSFGNNIQSIKGRVLIPKKSNSKIKSATSGKVIDIITNKSCVNQIVIESNEGYLEYCGITSPSVKTGDKVRVGDSLGTTNSNVTVTLYSRKKIKTNIELNNDENPKVEKPKNRDYLLVRGYHSLKKSNKEKEPETPKNKTEQPTNSLLVRGYRKLKKSFDTPKKLEENIERIKGLIK
jgi:hypothetical protein